MTRNSGPQKPQNPHQIIPTSPFDEDFTKIIQIHDQNRCRYLVKDPLDQCFTIFEDIQFHNLETIRTPITHPQLLTMRQIYETDAGYYAITLPVSPYTLAMYENLYKSDSVPPDLLVYYLSLVFKAVVHLYKTLGIVFIPESKDIWLQDKCCYIAYWWDHPKVPTFAFPKWAESLGVTQTFKSLDELIAKVAKLNEEYPGAGLAEGLAHIAYSETQHLGGPWCTLWAPHLLRFVYIEESEEEEELSET